MRNVVLGFVFLFSTAAFAGNFVGKYGLGIAPDSHSPVEVKLFSAGYQDTYLHDIMLYQLEAGVFADSHGDGRRSSGFTAASTGIRVDPGTVYAEMLWGVALITSPDSMLSTAYEFTNDTVIGIRDSKGRAFGIGYKHFSNAGIQLPNKGRDFVLIHFQVPL
jgi:hypothetical protein